MTMNWLEKINSEVVKDFNEQQRILSFSEYLHLVEKESGKQLRSSAEYIIDTFDHFGRDEKTGHFNLFDQEFADARYRLVGNEKVQNQIYSILKSFVREGLNNKLILLHGPNGSAKSSLINCIVRGLENYSETPEGALYKFHWIFPVNETGKSGLGLGSKRDGLEVDSYAKLMDTEIAASIPCDLKDHPLFLIPKENRKEFLSSLKLSHKVSEYLLKGDLSHKSRMIYEALLLSYKGDYQKVLRHIQVERFYISKRYREGIVTIEPQMSVDAQAQQVTMDRSLSMLPPALHSLNLVNLRGDLIDGNRGLIEYNDLLKRPIDAFKYLLGTCETGTVSVMGNTAFIDSVLIGTCNEVQLDAFKEYPDFTSFKARIELVRVPYLLKVDLEKKIYESQIDRIAGEHHVAPHSLELISMWAVLCRLKKANAANYPSSLAYLINALNPLEKAMLYNKRKLPSRLTEEDKKLLRSNITDIENEYEKIPYYEGRSGPSPREIKLILFEALSRSESRILSPHLLFDVLDEFVGKTSEYGYLRENVVEGYHDCKGFIEVVRSEYLNYLDDEVRSSLGMYDEQMFGSFLEKYINHISHYLKKELVRNPITERMEEPDKQIMNEFEQIVKVTEDRDKFRGNLITKIGVYTLNNQQDGDGSPDYVKIFPDLIKKMRAHYQNEHKNLLKRVYEAMTQFLYPVGGEKKEPQTVEHKESYELANNLINNLQKKYGYNLESAKEAFSYLVQKRY